MDIRTIILMVLALVVLVMGMVLMDATVPVPVDDSRRILDSVRYEAAMERLVSEQRTQIEALRRRGKRLTLQLDSLAHAMRHRPPSRINDDDSLRAAILRAAGVVQPR
jgi:Arc/MetJ family transcription regulator